MAKKIKSNNDNRGKPLVAEPSPEATTHRYLLVVEMKRTADVPLPSKAECTENISEAVFVDQEKNRDSGYEITYISHV